MLNSNRIDFAKLDKAIKAQHHAVERFFDVDFAETQRAECLEMAERLRSGMASREDEDAAIELIQQYI
jgi:hypothetical protein